MGKFMEYMNHHAAIDLEPITKKEDEVEDYWFDFDEDIKASAEEGQAEDVMNRCRLGNYNVGFGHGWTHRVRTIILLVQYILSVLQVTTRFAGNSTALVILFVVCGLLAFIET